MSNKSYYIKKRNTIQKPDIGPPPNWRQMIDQIIRIGVPKAHIAEHMNISREYLYNGIYSGRSEPPYTAGKILIALAKSAEELSNAMPAQ